MTYRYLGQPVTGPLAADQLDTVDVPPGVASIELTTDELCAVCPVTGHPDIYSLRVQWTPGGRGRGIESKAFKLYLLGFRDEPVMCEPLAARIAADLAPVVGVPVYVELRQQPRGGLQITATANGNP